MASISSDRPSSMTSPVDTAPTPHNRACDACRLHKVRCLPDPTSKVKTCQRCTKTSRVCQFTAPQKRKQRKRTDTRVAELEREVQAMRALFERKKESEAVKDVSAGSGAQEVNEQQSILCEPGHENRFSISNSPPSQQEWQRQAYSTPMPPVVPGSGSTASPTSGVDVIERGIVSSEQAVELFDIYKRDLQPHFPAIVFEDHITMEDLRRSKPMLFLAIIAAACGKIDPSLYSTLQSEFIMAYAHRTLILSEKSLELVQAMIITVIWYYPPGKFGQLKFFEYISMATAMAVDLGIGSSAIPWSNADVKPAPSDSETGSTQELRTDFEKRRAFLACYTISTGIVLGLRRPALLRFNKQISDSIETLWLSPYSSAADKNIARWAKLISIGEEVSASFSFDDDAAHVSLSDSRVQLMQKGFERALEAWKAETPPELLSDSLSIAYNHMTTYIHEIAMHDDHPPEDFRPPYLMNNGFTNKQHPANIALYIDSLAACVSGAQATIDKVLTLDIDVLRATPIFNYARLMYACIVLVKLHASGSTSSSALKGAIDVDSLRVDYYLENVIERLIAAVGPVEFRAAYTFCGTIMRLRKWHTDEILGKKEPAAMHLYHPNDRLAPESYPSSTGGTPDSNPSPVPSKSSILRFTDEIDRTVYPIYSPETKREPTMQDDDLSSTQQYGNMDMAIDADMMALFDDMGQSYGGDLQNWEPNMIIPNDLGGLEMGDTYTWDYGQAQM